jgi:hypothetical protein
VHVAALVGHAIIELGDNAAHLAGVAAHHEIGQSVDGSLARPPKTVEGRLADAVLALIGNDPDEEPVFQPAPTG